MHSETFDLWCDVVNMYLLLSTGRPLADAPYSAHMLGRWWLFGCTARTAANVIAHKMAGVPRYTFTRYHTDDRVYRVQESMIGVMRV